MLSAAIASAKTYDLASPDGKVKVCIEAGAPGTMTYVKINYAPTGVLSIEEKCTKHRK